ncbi:MAG: hypothetical protein JXR94_22405 [Candidatus Hydrogenedentes bacterium]|nr:hypothetical protein [Candidatus Hydrogenedentota bacterium]
MPVSTSIHLSYCVALIVHLAPRSVLDIGCGFGVWGFLCREYLDVSSGRIRPQQWKTRIDGIELFEPYVQDHQRALYSSIRIADIRDALPDLDTYDLIIAGDVIEHLEKGEGEDVLEALYDKAQKALLVNIPLGEGWEHPEAYGNPGELHRSMWAEEDFTAYPHALERFQLPNGLYGVFCCLKNVAPTARRDGLMASAERYERRGDAARAIRALERAQALDPACREAGVLLADLAIRHGTPNRAVGALETLLAAVADYHEGHVMLAKLLASLGLHKEARERLGCLLQMSNLAAQIRQEAEALLHAMGR